MPPAPRRSSTLYLPSTSSPIGRLTRRNHTSTLATTSMNRGLFPTTRRSIVLALASDDSAERTRAFDALVAIYWKPLYKYARFAHQRAAADAEDVTQSFLAKAFERNSLATSDAGKASFRTFLRLLFDRHIANELKSATRQKRGGDQAHLDFASAEAEVARD